MGVLRGFPVFALVAVAVALAIALTGGTFALERFGAEAARAWRLGCFVTLGASLLSGLAVAAGSRVTGQGVTLALGSMLLRLVVVAFAGAAVVLLLGVEARSFLLAVAVSYLALLVVDTWFALSVVGTGAAGESAGPR